MLRLIDKIGFGKHKGRQVHQLIETDPEYMRWLRDEKLKHRQNLLDPEADAELQKQFKHGQKLKPRFSLKNEELREELQAQTQRVEAYQDQWGEW